jgi:hypothetical protein
LHWMVDWAEVRPAPVLGMTVPNLRFVRILLGFARHCFPSTKALGKCQLQQKRTSVQTE